MSEPTLRPSPSRSLSLEVLETLGVIVGALRADDFPAFYAASSGLAAPHAFADAREVARASDAARALGVESGLLLAVPHPSPADGDAIEAAVRRALAEADADPRVGGARVTPFVLARVNELTRGAAVRSNVALVENNARVGADVAVALVEEAAARGEDPSLNLST